MNPIIYNLDGIRAPLTGVGRYAVELIREVLLHRTNIIGIKSGKTYAEESLHILLTELDSMNVNQHLKSRPNFINLERRLRGLVGNTPFTRSVYQALNNRTVAKLSEPFVIDGGLFHDLNYSLGMKVVNKVSTVYDLSNVICPGTHPQARVNHINAYFEKLRSSDSQIITITHAVKSELIEQYDICENRVHVTHLAADNSFHPRSMDECQALLETHAISYKKYVLCVGTLEPRKNLTSILSAYKSLDKQIQQEFPLVLVGPIGWKDSALTEKINLLHKSGVVKRLGFVAQSDLPFLYAGATAFVYPSLYEGFGLPLLEAMQSGCPCITSNTGALAEVSNGSAIQVDPRKSDDIAQQLNLLLHAPDLHSHYASAGLQRSSNFTWAKTAAQTCEIYDSL